MDKNTILGFLMIFAILILWQTMMAPDAEELPKAAAEQEVPLNTDSLKNDNPATLNGDAQVLPGDTPTAMTEASLATAFGPFAPAARGEEQFFTLENELLRLRFSNKGGRLMEAELKEHFKILRDSTHKEFKVPLQLFGDDKDKFEYLFPVANVPSGAVNSADLYFEGAKSSDGQSVTFRAMTSTGAYFQQRYTLQPGSYGVLYDLEMPGLDQVLDRNRNALSLHWVNYLDKLELNHQYERNYSTVYFKAADGDSDYCSCTSNDQEDLSGSPVDWVAHSNQFFAVALMAKEAPFKGAELAVEVLDTESEDLKKVGSSISVPYEGQQFAMEMYIGPKDFETLRAYDNQLDQIIPFGNSIMGAANRWVIRPLFEFLTSLIGIKGLAIIFLTFLVKLALFPLTYKMIYSQSKMSALKPQIEGLRKKFKDDQSQIQMETMKLYREFGVNPLGGCFPVVLQMPIWFALYRFFPASIEFRQVSFLWATDLSSYDAAFWLPFTIPFYGQHISLFTLLWVVSTIAYTYYNMKVMDMSSMGGANATMMKYMQYLMPVFFLFFFNNFASGLTCYLVFSNLFNIGQTIITKNYIIDQEKIMEELEINRKKPKKKGGFQARLEDAMKQQQAIAAQRDTAKSKGKRK